MVFCAGGTASGFTVFRHGSTLRYQLDSLQIIVFVRKDKNISQDLIFPQEHSGDLYAREFHPILMAAGNGNMDVVRLILDSGQIDPRPCDDPWPNRQYFCKMVLLEASAKGP